MMTPWDWTASAALTCGRRWLVVSRQLAAIMLGHVER